MLKTLSLISLFNLLDKIVKLPNELGKVVNGFISYAKEQGMDIEAIADALDIENEAFDTANAATALSELPPVEIRSSTTTTLVPAFSSPSIWLPMPWSFGFGRTYANGKLRASATRAPCDMAPVATPATASASGKFSMMVCTSSSFTNVLTSG